jgi:putative glycosyltransferase (TIGR04372 family)
MIMIIKEHVQQTLREKNALSKVKLLLKKTSKVPLYILAIPAVLGIRLIRHWLLVRIGNLRSSRLGHFAGEPEIYLCEVDAGMHKRSQWQIDIFYMGAPCNQQLAVMWRRVLRIWPLWILGPIYVVNQLIPGGKLHDIDIYKNLARDVDNLLERSPPHLIFTAEEEKRGEAGLRSIGLPVGAKFVCLNVRDSAYLEGVISKNWEYHNYRDSNVQNYILAAKALAELGYFVIRMGAKVHEAINSSHPKVIDYAFNGMRNDFMDIYLGSRCAFCISTGTGWEVVPGWLFRKPICNVNHGPVGDLCTWANENLLLTKHHIEAISNRELSLRKIFKQGVDRCYSTSDYESKGIYLIENTAEEIHDIAIEMHERINGTWQPHDDDELLQRKFWEIFALDDLDRRGRHSHGVIRSRFGASFLRNNPMWLE